MRRARWALVGVVVVAGAGLLEWDRRAWDRALAELEGVSLGPGGRSAHRTVHRARARTRSIRTSGRGTSTRERCMGAGDGGRTIGTTAAPGGLGLQ